MASESHAGCDGALLEQHQQRAIEMAYFGGLTYREIAERDDLPLGTVKGQLRLGLRRLYGLVLESVACQADGERRSGCTQNRRIQCDG